MDSKNSKGEFHLIQLDMLVDRWNREETKEFSLDGGENE
jgi:hypothetical protein